MGRDVIQDHLEVLILEKMLTGQIQMGHLLKMFLSTKI